MKQTSLSNTGHSLHCSILAAVNDPGVRSLISRELEEDALLFVDDTSCLTAALDEGEGSYDLLLLSSALPGLTAETADRIIAGGAVFLIGLAAEHLLHLPKAAVLGIMIAAYVILGWDVVWKAVRNITRGQFFDEHFLMSISTVGAFVLGEYPEAAAVMLFYQIGEYFQSMAVKRSRRSISALLDIRPDTANVLRGGTVT